MQRRAVDPSISKVNYSMECDEFVKGGVDGIMDSLIITAACCNAAAIIDQCLFNGGS